jgi:chromosome segregation and condensation protein ScpB
MKENTNFEPLIKFLSEEVSSEQLARLLDELAYDYFKTSIRLQQTDVKDKLHFHPEAAEFLFYLKSLRDVLNKCKANE